MRACARVALALLALSASLDLAGCAATDEVKEAFLRWVESEKLPSGRGLFTDDSPDATPVIPPEEPLKREATKSSKPVKQRADYNGRRSSPIPNSTEASRREGTEAQSAPSLPPPPQLPSRFPPAPSPGRFSR